MRGLLVRVAVDQSEGGGYWNGPVDSSTSEFVYVAIPEVSPTHHGLNKPYAGVSAALDARGCVLPPHLTTLDMHLDPDFEHLTYGDQGERGKRGAQIVEKLGSDDLLVFYAALEDARRARPFVYALIGLYVIASIIPASAVPRQQCSWNAHTRRVKKGVDIVVTGRRGVSVRAPPRKWSDLAEMKRDRSPASDLLTAACRVLDQQRRTTFGLEVRKKKPEEKSTFKPAPGDQLQNGPHTRDD